MTSPVIICADRFVQKFRRADFLPGDSHSTFSGHTPRCHRRKTARICQPCVRGKHSLCPSESCTCVHREDNLGRRPAKSSDFPFPIAQEILDDTQITVALAHHPKE